MKLMIVDDEVFAVQGIMEGVNWDVLDFEEVYTANGYEQAVEQLMKTPVDILLCDIEMPDESGLALIGWMNEHYPATECIILSCHDEFDFARQAVQLECLDYILKPCRYEALTVVLERAVEIRIRKKRQNFLKEYGQIYIDHITDKAKPEEADIVKKAARYINEHLAEALSVSGVANRMYVSPDHLTRSFKKKYNITVSDYILQKRMNMAGELLKRDGMTITMVSDSVGFGNYSYFTEQFKKVYGMTPREYQNRNKS